MAVKITIYSPDVVTHFDDFTGTSFPDPWLYAVGSYMRYQRLTHTPWWYVRRSADYGWEPIEIAELPKKYQLLNILE